MGRLLADIIDWAVSINGGPYGVLVAFNGNWLAKQNEEKIVRK